MRRQNFSGVQQNEKHAAEVLLSEYGVRLAMITMGPRGAYLANRNAVRMLYVRP